MRKTGKKQGKNEQNVNSLKTNKKMTFFCKNSLANNVPIGDIAEFEDVANAVYYLGSDESRITTGAELVVDGGNTIQLYPIIK